MKLKHAVGLALILLVSTPLLATDCPSVGFTLEQTLTGYPSYVENLQTVDYDHDGNLDLVGGVVQPGAYGELYRWRGLGDGTFAAGVSLGDTQVLDVEVADVNNDGVADLIGASLSYIFVRLGNATGFDARVELPTNYLAYDLQVGNFNEGTGNVDVVVSSLLSGVFVVYQGNGNGTFTETRRVLVGTANWVTGSVVADFDHDGRYDVALARRQSEKLEVYFRNVDGTFASPVNLTTGTWPDEIAAGDFNGDNLPELVTNTWDDGTVEVFDNLGSRTFSTHRVFAGSLPGHSGSLNSLRVLDINGDTKLDIMAGGVNGPWIVTFLGGGDLTFQTGSWFEIPGDAYSFVAGNFDGATDASLELAVGSLQKLFAADYVCTPQVHLHTMAPTISSGQPARLRATVTGISGSTPTPLGTVSFKEGTTNLGTIPVDSAGLAALDANGLSVGEHTIHAEFSGNSTIGPLTSTNIVQTVTSMTSSTTMTIPATTSGESFDATVTVTGQFGDTVFGDYSLTLDGVRESEARWSGAPLTLTLNAGPHSMSAEFAGLPNEPPSTSPIYDFTTAKHPVTLVRSGDTTMRQGTPHVFQVSLGVTTQPPPSGNVELFRGTTPMGTAALSNATATFNLVLPRGSYEYHADYAGDANYLSGSVTFTLNVVANTPLAIDARGLESAVYIPAVLPPGTTQTTMYRRVANTSSWTAVSSWSPASPYDDGVGVVRGIPYDYQLEATVGGDLQQSNIDSAMLYTDPSLVAGVTRVKTVHYRELELTINMLRTMAGLPPFAFSGLGNGVPILASHMTAMRNAVTQACSALGMATPSFTDPTPAGATIKRVHITELREMAR